MDLELGYLTKALTERSILGMCGAAETLEETAPEPFKVNLINDFSQDSLKAEKTHYDEKKVIPVKGVCSSYHGGPLDYPKGVSKAIGDIISKWGLCFEQTQLTLEEERRKPKEVEDSSTLGLFGLHEVLSKTSILTFNMYICIYIVQHSSY